MKAIKGKGSITPLEDKPRGKCRKWRLRVSTGEKDPKTGKYKPPYSRNFTGTYREAEAALREFIAEIEGDQIVKRCGISFGDFTKVWLEERKTKVAYSTWKRDEGLVRVLNMHLKNALLEEIDASMVDDVYTAIMNGDTPTKKKPSGTYGNMLAATLSKILKRAKSKKLIVANPCDDVTMPAIDTKEKKALNHKQIVDLVEKMDPCKGSQLSILMSIKTGIRRGETCGLAWGDVNFSDKTITIAHARDVRGELGDTKTISSERVIPLPDSLAANLLARKRYIEAEFALVRSKTGTAYPKLEPSTPIICNALGEGYAPHAITTWWDRNRKKLGFEEWTVHEMRHSYLTEMARRKIDTKTLQKLAGHAKYSTTEDIYVHVSMEQKREAVEAMDW